MPALKSQISSPKTTPQILVALKAFKRRYLLLQIVTGVILFFCMFAVGGEIRKKVQQHNLALSEKNKEIKQNQKELGETKALLDKAWDEAKTFEANRLAIQQKIDEKEAKIQENLAEYSKSLQRLTSEYEEKQADLRKEYDNKFVKSKEDLDKKQKELDEKLAEVKKQIQAQIEQFITQVNELSKISVDSWMKKTLQASDALKGKSGASVSEAVLLEGISQYMDVNQEVVQTLGKLEVIAQDTPLESKKKKLEDNIKSLETIIEQSLPQVYDTEIVFATLILDIYGQAFKIDTALFTPFQSAFLNMKQAQTQDKVDQRDIKFREKFYTTAYKKDATKFKVAIDLHFAYRALYEKLQKQ